MKRLVLVGLMVASAVTVFAAGAGESRGGTTASSEVVTITHLTGWHGEHVFADYYAAELDRFYAEYGDEIHIENEEIVDSERDPKLAVLIAADALPDVFVLNDISVPKLAADAGQLVDMTPYLEEDPEWMASLSEANLEYWATATGQPGKYFGVSSHGDILGYFYNTEMFESVGITPAETWEEFFSNCDKLKAAGYTPVSMMGLEGGWLTDLWLLPIIGTTNEAGNEWVNSITPTNWETPEVIYGLGQIQKMLQEYTTSDAVGLNYVGGSNYFLNEQTAMIANGPWMIPSFNDPDQAAEGLYDRVSVAAFPGGATAQNPGYAFFNAAKTPETQDAVATFIKFLNDDEGQLQKLIQINLVPSSSNIDPSTVDIDPLLAELIAQAQGTVSVGWPWRSIPNTLLDTVTQQLAALTYNRVTPEQMARTLTEAASR